MFYLTEIVKGDQVFAGPQIEAENQKEAEEIAEALQSDLTVLGRLIESLEWDGTEILRLKQN